MKKNGHRPSHRNRWLLLKHKLISKNAFILFEYYLDQMDFDISHEAFGTFERDLEHISELFSYTNIHPYNSVRNAHNELIKLSLISETKKTHIYKVTNPKRYIAQTQKWQGKALEYVRQEMLMSDQKIIQNMKQEVQFNEHNVQYTEQKNNIYLEKNVRRTLTSSKVESNSTSLTKEDTDWINEAIINTNPDFGEKRR